MGGVRLLWVELCERRAPARISTCFLGLYASLDANAKPGEMLNPLPHRQQQRNSSKPLAIAIRLLVRSGYA